MGTHFLLCTPQMPALSTYWTPTLCVSGHCPLVGFCQELPQLVFERESG